DFLNSVNDHSVKNGSIFKPDIVFIDIQMPKMDGFQLLDELEKNQAFLQNPIDIYILSSSCPENDIETALNKRLCKGYFNKPLNRNKLKDLLN
ncbi:MAG: response regulator, partial [Maribacter sp.]|nr:response regulator [Maribacter sp.]